jgi:mannose/fructose/N-acetylgalactosamine-specific phosphotransferase system component IIB
MTLVLVRVDCRLIHGQVVEAWVPHTRADCIVVANDEAAEDVLQKSIMAMAVPPTIDVAILTVQEAAKDLGSGRWSDKRVILLIANCEDALACHRSGVSFDYLNLGNLVCSPAQRQITCSIFLNDKEAGCLQELLDRHIKVEARSLPRETPLDTHQIARYCLRT